MAENKLANIAKVIVNAISVNITEAMPSVKLIGKNTATVVKVEEITASSIWLAPLTAASKPDIPCVRRR